MDQDQAREAARTCPRRARQAGTHLLLMRRGWLGLRSASRSALAGTACLHLRRGRRALPSLQQRRCRRTAATAERI
jgi:hypothetical protein